MATREELAKEREAGAAPIDTGLPEPAAEPPVKAPPLDNDRRYLQHRSAAHTEDQEIAALEKKLGLSNLNAQDLAPPQSVVAAPQAPGIWDSITKGLKEMPGQAAAGSLNAFNELGNGLLNVADWAENKLHEHGIGSGDLVPEERAHNFGNMVFGDPETLAGRMTNSVSQFVTGFLPTNRAMQGARILQGASGALKIVQSLGAGAATDFAFFDPHQERLSNLIQEHPSLANPITAYLAADKGDSEMEGRVKNALEGMGLGAATDGLLSALKAYRGWRGLRGAAVEESRAALGAAEGGAGVPIKNPSTSAADAAASKQGVISDSERALQESASARQESAQAAQDIAQFEKTGQQPSQAAEAAPRANVEADGQSPESLAKQKQLVDTLTQGDAERAADETLVKNTKPEEPGVPRGTTQQSELAQHAAKPLEMNSFEVGGPQALTIEPKAVAKTSQEIKPSALVDASALELPGNKAININLNRINADTDLKSVISQVAEVYKPSIQSARRGRMTEETLAKLANDLNLSPEDLRTRLPGEAFNAEQLLASRAVLNASAENLLQKAKLAARAESNDIDRAAFVNALESHKVIQAQVSGAVAEAGRALRSQNMIVGLPTDAQKLRAMKEMIQGFGGGQSVSNMAEALSQITDVKSIAQVMQKSLTRKIGDAIYEVWVNGLLSGARTFTVNIGSNTAVMFGKIGERYAAEGLGLLKAGARGDLNADRVVLGEANAMVSGALNGLWDSFKMVGKAIRERTPIDQYTQVPTARVPALTAENFGASGMLGKAIDYLGVMTRWPGKAQMLADKFFQAVNYRMELQALAVREATYRNLKGKEFEDFVESIIKNPPDELHFKSIDEARLNTFTNERGQFSEDLIRTVHSHPVGRVVLPFLRTNLNMAEYASQRIPLLNYLSPQMRADMAAGGARADLAQAKLAWGFSLMAITSGLAAQGVITGRGPKDPKALDALKSTGWRPNSLKIGDTYYSYNRVEPFGTILGMAADWTELAGQAVAQDMDVSDMALAAASTAANISSAENLVESVVQFGEFVTDPEKNAKKYLSNLGASIVPAWLRQFAREGGDVKRNVKADTFKLDAARGRYVSDDNLFQETLNRIRASIPGYADDLPAQRNMFGEVVTYDPGVGVDIASPIYASKTIDSPIRTEMAKLSLNGKGFEMPNEFITTKMGAIPLSPQQYEKYVELSAGIGLKAPGFKRKLEDELNYQLKNNFPSVAVSERYKKLDEWRYAMIRDIIGKYRKAASIQMIAEEFSDDLQGKYNSLKGIKEEAVTGRKQGVSFTPPGGGTVR